MRRALESQSSSLKDLAKSAIEDVSAEFETANRGREASLTTNELDNGEIVITYDDAEREYRVAHVAEDFVPEHSLDTGVRYRQCVSEQKGEEVVLETISEVYEFAMEHG